MDKVASDEADGKEGDGGDENSQHVADDRSAQGHLGYNCFFSIYFWPTHLDFANGVSIKGDVRIVLQVVKYQLNKPLSAHKLHAADLCVKGKPLQGIVAYKLNIEFLFQA